MSAFKMNCAKTVLAQECPAGSYCAIQTSLADTTQVQVLVSSFLAANFTPWVTNLETSLMEVAQSAQPSIMLFEDFTSPTLEGVGSTLVSWASFGALAGLGSCIVVTAHFARKHTTQEELDLIPLE